MIERRNVRVVKFERRYGYRAIEDGGVIGVRGDFVFHFVLVQPEVFAAARILSWLK